MSVYLKNMRKSWLSGVIPPLLLVGFVSLMAFSWPSLKETIIARIEQMGNPIYKAILGDLGIEGLGLTWQAAAFMYTGGMMNILLLFISLYPAKILYQEIDKKSLDVILSYPVQRWKYLLEKFAGFLSYGLLYPLVIIGTIIFDSFYIGEEIDTNLVINYAIGIYLLIFALGSITLLCVSIFLDSNKSMTVAGIIVISMYLLESLGGIIQVLANIRFLSLFHYFKLDSILENGYLPIIDLIIVIGFGLIALCSSLVIFDKREFVI